MHATSSPPLSKLPWKGSQNLAVGRAVNSSASTIAVEQLESFLRERLDNWDVESAEAICTWGRVGDMCSPDYQSQLRQAHTALEEAQKRKAQQRGDTATHARHEAKTAARRRHRDRLAAEAHMRTESKVKAAQRQHEREEQKRRERCRGLLPSSTHREDQPLGAMRGAALGNVHAHPSQHEPLPWRDSVGATQQARQPVSPSAGQKVRRANQGPAQTPADDLRTCSAHRALIRTAPPDNVGRHEDDDEDDNDKSSSLTLTMDSQDDRSTSDKSGTGESLGESFSSTFVVRRMLTAHVHPTMALRHTITHHSPVKPGCPPSGVVASPSPRKVQPYQQQQLPHPRRRRSSSKTTAAGTNASLSPVDPSLPLADDEVTAIFASRSRSQEHKTSPPPSNGVGSSSNRGIAATAVWTPSGRDGSSLSPRSSHTAHGTMELASPIRDAHIMGELSSLSSAGSYFRGPAESN